MRLEEEQYREVELLKEKVREFQTEMLLTKDLINHIYEEHYKLSRYFTTLLICLGTGGTAALVSFLLQEVILKILK